MENLPEKKFLLKDLLRAWGKISSFFGLQVSDVATDPSLFLSTLSSFRFCLVFYNSQISIPIYTQYGSFILYLLAYFI